jgi:hypothetical protein
MVVLMRGCVRITNYDDYQSNAPVNQAGSHNVRTNRAQVNETKSEACEAVAHNVRTNSAQTGFPPPTPPSYKETTNTHSMRIARYRSTDVAVWRRRSAP